MVLSITHDSVALQIILQDWADGWVCSRVCGKLQVGQVVLPEVCLAVSHIWELAGAWLIPRNSTSITVALQLYCTLLVFKCSVRKLWLISQIQPISCFWSLINEILLEHSCTHSFKYLTQLLLCHNGRTKFNKFNSYIRDYMAPTTKKTCYLVFYERICWLWLACMYYHGHSRVRRNRHL